MTQFPQPLLADNNDSVYDDARMPLLLQMFPRKSKQEVNIVLGKFIGRQDQLIKTIDALMYETPKSSCNSLDASVHFGLNCDNAPGPSNANKPLAIDAPLNDEQKRAFASIVQIFENVDPHWVVNKLSQEFCPDELAQKMLAEPLFYDTIKTQKQKNMLRNRRDILMDPSVFDPAQFLEVYPDPLALFSKDTPDKSNLYRDHARIAIAKDFSVIRMDVIRKIMNRHHFNLYSSYKEVQKIVDDYENPCTAGPVKVNRRRPKEFLLKLRKDKAIEWPTNIDEAFFRELQFVRWEPSITQYQTRKREERERNLAAARLAGTVKECEICLADECTPQDMIACDNKHEICNKCVAQNVETKLELGRDKIECLAGKCDQMYTATALGRILNANVFSRLIRNMQLNELREAHVPNLHSCPFCDFAMIIDNQNDKLFTCLNPQCLKVSCRKCREENHIPLRCDEVEHEGELKMRIYIEEKVAEAYIRKCPNCSKPIIKETGCNKMICPCGAYFCYVCSEALPRINPYSHFTDFGLEINQIPDAKCAATTTMEAVHEAVALKAAEDAKQKYLSDNPKMKGKTNVKTETMVQHDPGLLENMLNWFGGFRFRLPQVPRLPELPHLQLPQFNIPDWHFFAFHRQPRLALD